MLPRPRRVTSPDEFRRVMRRGRKAGRSRLVVHALASGEQCSRAGFVVGRKVGPSVTRHRVTRRLRHLVGSRLDLLPLGTLLVVRAQTPAAGASSAELAGDLDAALHRLGLLGAGSEARAASDGSAR